MGTTVPYFFIMPIVIISGLKLINIKFKKYVKKVILTTYPMALATGGLLYSIIFLCPTITDNMIGLGLTGLIGIFTYFGLFYLFGLTAKEKFDIIKMFRS